MEWFWAMAVVVSVLMLLLCGVGILFLFRTWLESMRRDLQKPAYTLGAPHCSACHEDSDESQEDAKGLLLTCDSSGDEDEGHVRDSRESYDQEEDPEREKEAARLIKTWVFVVLIKFLSELSHLPPCDT